MPYMPPQQGMMLVDTLTAQLGISMGMAARNIAAGRFQSQFDAGATVGNAAALALLKNATPEAADLTPTDIQQVRQNHPSIFEPANYMTVDILGDGFFDADIIRGNTGKDVYFIFSEAPIEGGLVNIDNFSEGDKLVTNYPVSGGHTFIEAFGSTIAVAFGFDIWSFQHVYNVNLMNQPAELVTQIQHEPLVYEQVGIIGNVYGEGWMAMPSDIFGAPVPVV